MNILQNNRVSIFTVHVFTVSSVSILLDNKGQVYNGTQKQDHTLFVD